MKVFVIDYFSVDLDNMIHRSNMNIDIYTKLSLKNLSPCLTFMLLQKRHAQIR